MKKAAYALSAAILLLILAALAWLYFSAAAVPPASEVTPAPTQSPVPTPRPTPSPTPTPEPTPEPEPEYFVISMVGDCTIASSQHIKGSSIAFESVVGTDYAFPFAKTVQYFESDYFSVANLESTLTTSNASSGATFTFKSDPEYAQVFTEGSIEAVVLGNNHSGDYGEQGREDTRSALDAAGVKYADDGGWCIYERDGGIKIGLYSKLYPTTADVISGVTALREAGADVIIAGLHWGLEGSYRDTADQQAVGHAAIDAGADIVYGCHSHVLQRVEEYESKYIFYSLGNWSFGGNTAPRDRDTAIAQVTVKRDVSGEISLDSYTLIPCELSSAPNINNYQPQPYEPGSEGYSRAMSKLDGSFTGPDLTIDYSAFHKGESSESGSSENTESTESTE
jgi:poly-gamma-glutamate capsule biosynthesis protein CapA/YwtB (metallophosphatase superfamily)